MAQYEQSDSSREGFDLIIHGGTVVDGSGAPARRADVGIRGDRIVAVGALDGAGDILIWDNRCTLHRGLPFDDLRYRRDVQRATVQDLANSCEQEGVRPPEVSLRAAQ